MSRSCPVVCCYRPQLRRFCGVVVLCTLILITYVITPNLMKDRGSARALSQPLIKLKESVESYAVFSKFEKAVPSAENVTVEVVTKKPAARHSKFDLETLPRIMSCQEPSAHSAVVAKMEKIHDMTMKVCRLFCSTKGCQYGALFNGDSCYCMHQHGTSWLDKDAMCNVPCAGDKSAMCGGKDRWLFFKADEIDGDRSWTLWTSYGRDKLAQNHLRSRYRGCAGDRHARRRCIVERETRLSDKAPGNITELRDYFIGCFTDLSWKDKDLALVKSQSVVSSDIECIKKCQEEKTPYSVTLQPNVCLCSSSLGWGRPVDTCIHKYGALVFSTQSLKENSLTLQFEPRKSHKNVAVVAHYRAGSTFASVMFSEYPGALYVFEPASSYHLVWLGVNKSLANEDDRSKAFLERIYPLWFECRATDLPGIWLSRYPEWGEHNRGLDEYAQCKKAVASSSAPFTCSPFIEEKCLIAPIVAAKTTRMINAENMDKFIQLGTDMEIVHAFRDPRGTLLSRAKLEQWYRDNQLTHLEIACWELNKLRQVFEVAGKPNIHILHYEDLATDVLAAAQKIYKELGMHVPEEVITVLDKATGKTDAKRTGAYDIVQQNPKSRINSWVKTANHTMVNAGDATPECQQFFKSYPKYYKPLQEMVKTGLT